MAAWFKKFWGRALVIVVGLSCCSVAMFLFLRPALVPTVTARRQEVVQTVVASGRVLPAARVQLAALGLGRIGEVNAREGDRVTRGTLLARQDDEAAQADLARAQAVALEARIRLTTARGPTIASARQVVARANSTLADERADLSRLEQSAAGGGVTGQELEHARAAVRLRESERESADITWQAARGLDARGVAADLARAEADVMAARNRLADLRIVAPSDGVIVTRAVEVGDVVPAGQLVFELAVDGPVEVRIDPDESTLALLSPGQPALVSPDAFPDRRFDARVATIASAVDPQRGTIEVHLSVPAPPPELRADMTVSVDVEVARRASALVLPAQCIRGVGTSAPWVMLAVGGRAVRRDVELGAVGEGVVELLDGIEEGDRAISMEVSLIAVGERVRDGGARAGAP
jgi:HlyD family secretion protein